jgi:hypothetical protein
MTVRDAEELLVFSATLSYFHIHTLQRHIGGSSLLSSLAFFMPETGAHD